MVKNLPSSSAPDPAGGRSRERGSETGAVLKKKKKKNLPFNSGDVGSYTATKTPYSHK